MQRMSLEEFGNKWKQEFENFKIKHKESLEAKTGENKDVDICNNQIEILTKKVNLILDGCKHTMHRSENLKKTDALTKEEKFSIQGTLTRKFADLNEQYLIDYSQVQLSALEQGGAWLASFFGKSFSVRQQEAADKAASLNSQKNAYDEQHKKLTA